MVEQNRLIKSVPDFYTVRSLGVLRRTPGVYFDFVPMGQVGRIDAIDRVIHTGGAVSPGPVGSVERPWYMHTAQVDNLLVLHGTRIVDLYHSEHGLHQFRITANAIYLDGELLFEGPVILTWYHQVFHRVKSDDQFGSASLNLAQRDRNFNLDTNFSVYDLDTKTGSYTMIREGRLDQPGGN